MKLKRWLICFFLLCSTPIIWGNDLYSYGNCFYNMRYQVYADYLYWKALRDGVGVVVNTQRIFVNPTYQSGFRVGSRLLWNCIDLGARYTSYDLTSKRFANQANVNINYRMDFQSVDIELGYLFCFRDGSDFLKPFVGTKLVWINEKSKILLNNTDTITKLDDRGYGPYVGAEGKLGFVNHCSLAIGLRARGNMGLLDSTLKFKRDQTASPSSSSDESHSTVVAEVFVGLDLSYCDFSCFDTNLQFGYELQSYTRGFSTADLFALGGLVARLGIYF